jgi:hypothetical protein
VLRRWGRADLLDTYEGERRPVAEHNLARSADPSGSIRDADEALSVDLGGRVAHAWLPSRERRTSTLDLLGLGHTLFIGAPGTNLPITGTSTRCAPPVTVRRLDAITARGLGIRPGGGLLTRPDGIPTPRHAVSLAVHEPGVERGELREAQRERGVRAGQLR